ncbi:MAG: hypothetical protein ACHRXM_37725 [Isosphaerales bacterium]
MKLIIDLIIIGLVLLMTYVLTSEGLWGSAVMFFNVVFGALIAFNFYEPLASVLDRTGIGWGFSDTLCMMGLFCVSVLLLRLTTETIAPSQVRFPPAIYHAGRLIFGLAGALVTMAIIILSFHAAPVHKKLFNVIDYQTKPPFGMGLDHQWLGFFQYETGAVFARFGAGRRDPYHQYGHGGSVQVFDPRGDWLIIHQQSRPYGEGAILGEEAGGGAAGEAGQAPAAPAAGRAGRGGPPGAAPN